MSIQTIVAGGTGDEIRDKLNDNFSYLESLINAINTGSFKGLISPPANSIPTPIEGDWYFSIYNASSNFVIVPMGITVNAGELCFIQYLSSAWHKYVISDSIGGTGSMTGAQIVTALSNLVGNNRLPKSAVWGADFALNYRGTEDFNFPESSYIMKRGDFVVCQLGGVGSPYKDGDWAIAMVDGLTPINIEDEPDSFLILPFGSITDTVSATAIRDSLETLLGNEKLAKQYIYGSEKGLNYKGAGNLYDSAIQTSLMSVVFAGDMWIHSNDSLPSPGESNNSSDSSNLKDGDILMAIIDNADTDNFSNDTNWRIIRQSPMDYATITYTTSSGGTTNDTLDLYSKLSDVVKLTITTSNSLTPVKYFGKGVSGSRKKLWVHNNHASNPTTFSIQSVALSASTGIHASGVTPGNSFSYIITASNSLFIDAICINQNFWIITNIAAQSTSGPKSPDTGGIGIDGEYEVDFSAEKIWSDVILTGATEFIVNSSSNASYEAGTKVVMIINGDGYELTFSEDFTIISGVFYPLGMNVVEMIYAYDMTVKVIIHNNLAYKSRHFEVTNDYTIDKVNSYNFIDVDSTTQQTDITFTDKYDFNVYRIKKIDSSVNVVNIIEDSVILRSLTVQGEFVDMFYNSLTSEWVIYHNKIGIDINENARTTGYLSSKKCGTFAYISVADDTTCTVQNTYYPIAGTFTNSPMEDFSVVADPAIKYEGTLTQYFQINWSATFASDNNSNTISIGAKKGTNLITSSVMSMYCKTNGELYSLSGVFVVELAEHDTIQLVIASNVAGASISVTHFTTSIREFFD